MGKKRESLEREMRQPASRVGQVLRRTNPLLMNRPEEVNFFLRPCFQRIYQRLASFLRHDQPCVCVYRVYHQVAPFSKFSMETFILIERVGSHFLIEWLFRVNVGPDVA